MTVGVPAYSVCTTRPGSVIPAYGVFALFDTTSAALTEPDVAGLRVDRGVAGTVKAKDSVVVITWRLGDAVVDTGFRADESAGHRAVLDGLSAQFPSMADDEGKRGNSDRRHA
jgi:hypothetical protein